MSVISQSGIIEIGVPPRYTDGVDPHRRVYNLTRLKSGVIDLIPCYHEFNITELWEQLKELNKLLKDKKAIAKKMHSIFKVDFQKAAEKYIERLSAYGLRFPSSNVCCLRVYTTDDTVCAEQFTNSATDEILGKITRKVSNLGMTFSPFLRAYGEEAAKKTVEGVEGFIRSTVPGSGSVIDYIANFVKDMESKFKDAATLLSNIIIKGYRLSLPKIWMNSDYSTSFDFAVKLFSPYGHPKAIKKFVVEPLLYLLLLAVPQTEDGYTYGDFIGLRIKAYGMTEIPYGFISSISVRRGGRDTSYNIYKQPLEITLQITIQSFMDGFAANLGDDTVPIDVVDSDNSLMVCNTGSPYLRIKTVDDIVSSLSKVSSGPYPFYNDNTPGYQIENISSSQSYISASNDTKDLSNSIRNNDKNPQSNNGTIYTPNLPTFI